MEKDICTIEYFEDEERFADIINAEIFGGEQYIIPDDIQEKNRSIPIKWGRLGKKNCVHCIVI